MTFTEAAARLDLLIASIDREAPAEAQRAGQDLAALISNRVIQKGQTAAGGRFTPYSDQDVPAFFYFGRSRNASGEAAVRRAAKDRKGLSYRDFRQANRLNVGIKNFEFNGEMWRKFGVVNVRRTATGVLVSIGGTTTDSANKITWHTEREGQSIIKPSKTELAIVQGNLNRWLQSLVNRTL